MNRLLTIPLIAISLAACGQQTAPTAPTANPTPQPIVATPTPSEYYVRVTALYQNEGTCFCTVYIVVNDALTSNQIIATINADPEVSAPLGFHSLHAAKVSSMSYDADKICAGTKAEVWAQETSPLSNFLCQTMFR